MKILKNNCGEMVEVKHLPANMERGLKNGKTWVKGPLTGEFIAYTKRNYKTLQRVAKRGGPVYGSGRAFTVIVSDKEVFLEGSASNQYTLTFETLAERQKWTDSVIKKIDPEIILN